jgi:hypothetical protein
MKDSWKLRWGLFLAILVFEILVILMTNLKWKEFQWSWIYVFLVVDVICACIIFIPRRLQAGLITWTKKAIKLIGVDKLDELANLRSLVIIIISLPFSFYVLLGGITEQTSPVLQFTIIAVSTTLGGLVLTSANNRRIKRKTHDKLVKVAQKMIVAAVCFIIVVPLLFMVDLTGGIDVNHWDMSTLGWIRGVSFWLAGIGFYIGIFLFLIGALDLILTMRDLRVKK